MVVQLLTLHILRLGLPPTPAATTTTTVQARPCAPRTVLTIVRVMLRQHRVSGPLVSGRVTFTYYPHVILPL